MIKEYVIKENIKKRLPALVEELKKIDPIVAFEKGY
jgi:hypothetical protein